MGFNDVFSCLKEIFPQIDFRILRAVAVEHPYDSDAAVLDVLNELPLFAAHSSPVSTMQVEHPRGPPVSVERKDKGKSLMHQQVIINAPGASSGEKTDPNYHRSGSSHDDTMQVDEVHSSQNVPVTSEPIHTGSEELISNGTVMNVDVQVGVQLSPSGETTVSMPEKVWVNGWYAHSNVELQSPSGKTTISMPDNDWENGYLEDVHSKVGLHLSPSGKATLSMPEKDWANGSLEDVQSKLEDFDFSVDGDSSLVIREPCRNLESHAVDYLLAVESSAAQLDYPSLEHAPEIPFTDDNLQATGSFELTSKQDCSPREMIDIEETTTNSICNVNVLEEIIEDAKNNKKTLFSAMESVISMMREVEVQEKAVDSVNEEASRGGVDIMVRVEELKEMLAHAKDANNMHAGEVYGEKAILATEVRELQSRLLSLSDERDKSLAMLNEMRETLEARLDAAAEARKVAEQEKLEKEASAQAALAEQEAEMEKVVQESKLLEQEAEENSKLRDFLMDRGRTVDILQGEISVICQDVRLLKEKFDERVPLSQSVSSSQTTCILASSGSSLKSGTFDLLTERVESPEKSLERATPASSVDGLSSPKSRHEQVEDRIGNQSSMADQKSLLDDGWDVVVDKEFFDL